MYKHPNWVLGEGDMVVPARINFGEAYLKKMKALGNGICLINGATEEVLKCSDLLQTSMNVAVSLYQLGVRKGHSMAICSENRTEFFPAVVGAACTGAVLTTINIGYTDGELKHVINIAKPTTIFCSPLAYNNYEKTFKSLPFVKKIILFGNQTPEKLRNSNEKLRKSNEKPRNSNDKPRNSNVIMFNDLVIPGNGILKENVEYERFIPVEARADDPVFILYSSGTTGLPKGVVITHHNMLSICAMPIAQDPKLTALTIAPWYHVMGLGGTLVAMYNNIVNVYLAKFDVQLYLRCIEKYKIGQLCLPPPVLVAICKADIRNDVSTIKLIYSGAAPLHADTLQVVKIKFPGVKVLQGYGMTEVTLAATRDRHELAHKAKPGGVGVVSPGMIIKVADLETRDPLGPNLRGEICIRGPICMKGYYGRDSSQEFDDEGFYKTGDVGYYDDDRYFFIVDRLKELIKYKGYQVPPAEIEATLLQHESIKDAGVIGVEDKDGGEVPMAFVVKQPGSDISREDVQKFIAERLSNPKHLRGGVQFVDEIPKNPSGKILRKSLRAMAGRKSKL